MDYLTLTIFGLVYLAMILGGLPGLMIDRTGAALVGAIALVAAERLSPQDAWLAVDVPTISLLVGMMVVSAQLRLGGFYSALSRRIAGAEVAPRTLLALLIIVAGGLSAVLANDVVCLAMTPLLLEGCARRGLRPMPFLLALAAAANVGSAATLIGNPQNILIGEALDLDFKGYLGQACVPAALGLVVVWVVVVAQYRGRWQERSQIGAIAAPALNPWQAGKGLFCVTALVGLFVLAPWPRDVVALVAAGLLLLSRKMHSRQMLGLVDWQLLVLFIGLFVVNAALAASGALAEGMEALRDCGMDPHQPAMLFLISVVLSNIVSNVPATMLLLPAADHPMAGAILALSSTLAGNLLIVGSIANIIVVTSAAELGYRVTWRDHARVGVPVTVLTLALAAGWLVAHARLLS